MTGAGTEFALAALALAVLILVAIDILLLARIRRLSRGYEHLVAGTDGGSLEKVLCQHLNRVEAVSDRMEEMAEACRNLDSRLRKCVQHVGVVRFDAFEDVGGQLSFAIALLDELGDGVVFSSLHGRQESRFFAKPVREGRSEIQLSAEEIEALRRAGFEAAVPRAVRADR